MLKRMLRQISEKFSTDLLVALFNIKKVSNNWDFHIFGPRIKGALKL